MQWRVWHSLLSGKAAWKKTPSGKIDAQSACQIRLTIYKRADVNTRRPRCGRVRMVGVVVRNEGLDWSCPHNVYWRHAVARREAARIVLHGQSEFEASHVVLHGDLIFEV